MPDDFDGLPLHPLIVHAAVVIVPLAALSVILAAVWPRFRYWGGPLPAVLSLIGLVLVPLSENTGRALEDHVEPSALLERHTELADGLLPWMFALSVTSVAAYVMHRRTKQGRSHRQALTIAVAGLAIIAAVGTSIQVALIGHAGARSVWQDTDMGS